MINYGEINLLLSHSSQTLTPQIGIIFHFAATIHNEIIIEESTEENGSVNCRVRMIK